MGEDEDFAPAQVFYMARQFWMSFKLVGDIAEVRVLLIGGEDGIEAFCPQIMVSNLVTVYRKFLEDNIAEVRHERVR